MSISAQSTLNQLQNNTSRMQYENGRKNLGTGKLDREGFIRLILAQLQYQDPTAPQDNTQMLTQQLQLEQTEQMKNMVDTTKFSTAASLVGKEASLVDAKWDFENGVSGQAEWDYLTNQAKVVTGVIESVQFDTARGKALAKINGNYYDVDMIQQVSTAPVPSTGEVAINSETSEE